jgi:hypothetical protein
MYSNVNMIKLRASSPVVKLRRKERNTYGVNEVRIKFIVWKRGNPSPSSSFLYSYHVTRRRAGYYGP